RRAAAARTRAAVSGRIRELPCRTSDTVDFDTSAARARSVMVTARAALRLPAMLLALASEQIRPPLDRILERSNNSTIGTFQYSIRQRRRDAQAGRSRWPRH